MRNAFDYMRSLMDIDLAILGGTLFFFSCFHSFNAAVFTFVDTITKISECIATGDDRCQNKVEQKTEEESKSNKRRQKEHVNH